jgi:hypothetical protein
LTLEPSLTSSRRLAQTVCGDQYPRIAIQLPMFNERAVCQAAIDSACEQSWPKSKLIVQVCHGPMPIEAAIPS